MGRMMEVLGSTPDLVPKPRVALLTNIPAPYRLPFFERLNQLCRLNVLFDALSEPNRQWVLKNGDLHFPYQVLSGFMIPYMRRRNVKERRFQHFRYDLIPRLVGIRPDVVVSAEMGIRSLQAEAYCRLTKTPLIIWWEGTSHTEGVRSKAKQFVRKYLVSRATRFWTNGKESTALLQTYGADLADIDPGMTGIDTMALSSEVNGHLSNRAHIRAQLEVNGLVLLFVGQFIERKGIMNYLAALDLVYRAGIRNWSLLFFGTGDLEAELQKWQREHPDVRVKITGFVQPREMPQFFSAADIFVLPTLDDNWPLATLEALVAGLPQLFSVYNGCTVDLLLPGITGQQMDPNNVGEFAAMIKEWIKVPPPRLSFTQTAELVDYYSPAAMAQRGLVSLENAIKKQAGS